MNEYSLNTMVPVTFRLQEEGCCTLKRIDRRLIDWHYSGMHTGNNHQEKSSETELSAEKEQGVQLTVRQPEKIQSLLFVLADLEKISEAVSEDRSQDLGGAGASATQAGTGDDAAQSQRQKTLQSLPSTTVMRRNLTTHLQREVRQLERKAKRLARTGKKGSAYLLNELYARIRKLQALIAELVDAAADVVRRLYIRLFVDHQQLV